MLNLPGMLWDPQTMINDCHMSPTTFNLPCRKFTGEKLVYNFLNLETKYFIYKQKLLFTWLLNKIECSRNTTTREVEIVLYFIQSFAKSCPDRVTSTISACRTDSLIQHMGNSMHLQFLVHDGSSYIFKYTFLVVTQNVKYEKQSQLEDFPASLKLQHTHFYQGKHLITSYV